MDGGGFIRELCIALEYRWKPDATFLLFIAHFDESDTHGPAPHMVMSGFLGTARQWELFERKINALRQEYGFKIFHAKDFRAARGEFEGWSLDKRKQLFAEIGVVIQKGLTEGVTAILPRNLYDREYRSGPVPKRMRLDTQYGICFRVCMHRLINQLTAENKKHKLHIVIEHGHKNVGDASRVFDELKTDCLLKGVSLLGTITITRKIECLPLMVADFLAHAHYLSEARVRIGLPSYYEMPGIKPPKRGRANLTQIEVTVESLHGLKAAWEEAKQNRIEKWRAARDVRRASSSVSQKEQPS